MATISAHDIFKQVKDQVFYLRELGELSVPVGEHIEDKLTAYWQNENEITVEFKGEKIQVPCNIQSKDYDYIARCIMSGFAQLYLGKNESSKHNLSKNDMMEAVESVVERLIKEGIMETDGDYDNEENGKECHFIWENDKIILRLLHEIAGGYSNYAGCDIEKYDAYVDFGDVVVYVSMDDDGYIYVSKVEGSTITISGRQQAVSVWNEVADCIKKINGINTRICDMQISGRRNY